MAKGQVVILRGDLQRHLAKQLIDKAPTDAVVEVRAASRSTAQNARLWAMLSDVSRARPDGRCHTPDVWKQLFMHACGHAVQFEMGLDGQPFPSGFRSSRLSVAEMRDLIDFIGAWGSERGVRWSEPHPDHRSIAA